MMKLMVHSLQRRDLRNSHTGEFPKSVFLHCVLYKISKKVRLDKLRPTGCSYLQWFQTFFSDLVLPSLFREATTVTLKLFRGLKVMTNDIKALHIAFLGTAGTIFRGSLKNPNSFISKKLSLTQLKNNNAI